MFKQLHDLLQHRNAATLSGNARAALPILLSGELSAAEKETLLGCMPGGSDYAQMTRELCLLEPYYQLKYQLTYSVPSARAQLIFSGFLHSHFLFGELTQSQYHELAQMLDVPQAHQATPQRLAEELGKAFFKETDKQKLTMQHKLENASLETRLVLLGFELHMGNSWINGDFYGYPEEHEGSFAYHNELLEVVPDFYQGNEYDLFEPEPVLSLAQRIAAINEYVNNSNAYHFDYVSHCHQAENIVELLGYFDYHYEIKIKFKGVSFAMYETVWERAWKSGSFELRMATRQEHAEIIARHQLSQNKFGGLDSFILIKFMPNGAGSKAAKEQTHVIACSELSHATGLFDKATTARVILPRSGQVSMVSEDMHFSSFLLAEGLTRWLKLVDKASTNLAATLALEQPLHLECEGSNTEIIQQTAARLVKEINSTAIVCHNKYGLPLHQEVTLPVPELYCNMATQMERLLEALTKFRAGKKSFTVTLSLPA